MFFHLFVSLLSSYYTTQKARFTWGYTVFFNCSNSKCQPVREILFVQKWRSKTGGHPCAHHIDEVMKPCYCSAVLTAPLGNQSHFSQRLPTSSLQYVNILAIANVLIINKSLSPCSISNFIHQKRLPFASAISCPKCFLFSGMVLEHGVPSAYRQELLKNVQKDWCALPMFQMFKNIDNV